MKMLYILLSQTPQNKKAHELKVWYKSEFNKMKQERTTREQGKIAHKTFAHILNVIDMEATEQRAFKNKPALPTYQSYYSHASKAINKALFDEQIKRDALTDAQLQQLERLEVNVSMKFTQQFQGFLVGSIDYHDIYKMLKKIIEDEARNIKELQS